MTALHITGVVVVLVALVLGLVVAGALIWRGARQLRRHADELRGARARLQCLDDLVDVWQWRTDAAHQLTWLRPPRGAVGAHWSGALSAPATLSSVLRPSTLLPGTPPSSVPGSASVAAASGAGTALWERFKVGDEAALRARLASHAPLDAIDVQPGPGAGAGADADADSAADTSGLAGQRWQLHGRIYTDANGAFAGYHGVLRATGGAASAMPAAVAAALHEAAGTPVKAPGSAPGNAPIDTQRASFESDHEAFSFTVSHDLRAPIRVVEGFTKIVKEDYGRLLDRVGNEHLDRVLSAAARMNNMIDALLALARLASQPLACQPVDLSQLAGYVADDLRREWPGLAVTLEIAPSMRVQGDPTLLRVVLENLLGNAWKYSARSAQPHISFMPQDGASDVFTVSDNGAGFDMRFADRLFGVFQRLHSATDFPGSGVGLASVRRIVRRHGGDIWGEGEVGRGASFHFSLPRRDPRGPESRRSTDV